MVTGAFCNNTALISSAVTGPEAADVDPVFDDDAPLADALLFEEDAFSSLAEDFVS